MCMIAPTSNSSAFIHGLLNIHINYLMCITRVHFVCRSSLSKTGEILFGKLLNGRNYLSKFLPCIGKVVLDTRWNLKVSLPLYEPQFLQGSEPLGERLRAYIPHESL